jgi:hypothetical protein
MTAWTATAVIAASIHCRTDMVSEESFADQPDLPGVRTSYAQSSRIQYKCHPFASESSSFVALIHDREAAFLISIHGIGLRISSTGYMDCSSTAGSPSDPASSWHQVILKSYCKPHRDPRRTVGKKQLFSQI